MKSYSKCELKCGQCISSRRNASDVLTKIFFKNQGDVAIEECEQVDYQNGRRSGKGRVKN